jgi:hypothetical protein
MYVCIYTYIYTYMCVYIYRERETDRQTLQKCLLEINSNTCFFLPTYKTEFSKVISHCKKGNLSGKKKCKAVGPEEPILFL